MLTFHEIKVKNGFNIGNDLIGAVCWVNVDKLIDYLADNLYYEKPIIPYICRIIEDDLFEKFDLDVNVAVLTHGVTEQLTFGLECDITKNFYGLLSTLNPKDIIKLIEFDIPEIFGTSPVSHDTITNLPDFKLQILNLKIRIALLQRLQERGIEQFPVICEFVHTVF